MTGETDFFAKVKDVLEAGMKLKKVMIEKKITSAKAVCPRGCGGHIHGRLAGRKNHLRMWCDRCEDVRMME